MALASLLEQEREVVEATLWFANLDNVETTSEVEDHFKRLKLVPGVFQILEADNTAAYLGDQGELCDWLSDIARSDTRRAEIGKRVADRLATVSARVTFSNEELRYLYGI